MAAISDSEKQEHRLAKKTELLVEVVIDPAMKSKTKAAPVAGYGKAGPPAVTNRPGRNISD